MKSAISAVSALLLLSLVPSSLWAQDAGYGEFPPVDLIETELQRGVSTTGDVVRVLGKPAGHGGYLAIMDGIPRDVWYYHNINSSLIDTRESVMRMHVHTRVLVIFFAGERFDGYKWFAASGAGRGKATLGGSQ